MIKILVSYTAHGIEDKINEFIETHYIKSVDVKITGLASNSAVQYTAIIDHCGERVKCE